ncbi:intradiol ring-cleavage dioxygenase [Spirosoma taeanense]|uniref:Intradiol ring-cleavage dioxygenase n=1 Tax=Spirosoma taeanense TaxID=2735870 RepID=A0A6M5YAH7_9BACT|nr:intradiol ring-cleavage dioxygenase [Spirosoma taeanense]QJW90534.1 intradiol ring-cleavage dioxygenase [Spirosoma taeanense]
MDTTRRRFFALLSALPLFSFFSTVNYRRSVTLLPTPPCDDHDEPTPPLEEGPFYSPRSPERNSLLEQGMAGTPLVLSGQVLNTNCKPVANVLLDWWQADNGGEYDNKGFRLRGHQYSDRNGRFQLETIVPGLYPGRTRHLHVKVQAPNQRILTTQLFFPDEPHNQRDRIFDPALLMAIRQKGDTQRADYTFVVNA